MFWHLNSQLFNFILEWIWIEHYYNTLLMSITYYNTLNVRIKWYYYIMQFLKDCKTRVLIHFLPWNLLEQVVQRTTVDYNCACSDIVTVFLSQNNLEVIFHSVCILFFTTCPSLYEKFLNNVVYPTTNMFFSYISAQH